MSQKLLEFNDLERQRDSFGLNRPRPGPATLPGRTTGGAGCSGAWGGLKDRPRGGRSSPTRKPRATQQRNDKNAKQSQKLKRCVNSMTWDDNKNEFERGKVGDALHRGQSGAHRGQLPRPRNSRVPRGRVKTRPAIPRAASPDSRNSPGANDRPVGRSGAWGGLKDRPRRWAVLPNEKTASCP